MSGKKMFDEMDNESFQKLFDSFKSMIQPELSTHVPQSIDEIDALARNVAERSDLFLSGIKKPEISDSRFSEIKKYVNETCRKCLLKQTVILNPSKAIEMQKIRSDVIKYAVGGYYFHRGIMCPSIVYNSIFPKSYWGKNRVKEPMSGDYYKYYFNGDNLIAVEKFREKELLNYEIIDIEDNTEYGYSYDTNGTLCGFSFVKRNNQSNVETYISCTRLIGNLEIFGLSKSDKNISNDFFELKFEFNEYKNSIIKYSDYCLSGQYYAKKGSSILQHGVKRFFYEPQK